MKPGILPQLPKGVAAVGKYGVEPVAKAFFASLFVHLCSLRVKCTSTPTEGTSNCGIESPADRIVELPAGAESV